MLDCKKHFQDTNSSSTYHRGDSGTSGSNATMSAGAMNCRPTGICQPLSPEICCVPNVTSEATSWPNTIISCNVDVIIPRRTLGDVSAR